MIDRQKCYSALFTLKNAGINIDEQLKIMAANKGVPQQIIVFLRENSPQFQFYRYIQKYQRALAKSILDYKELSEQEKLITCSSLVTRALIAVKYKNLDPSLLDELNLNKILEAMNMALQLKDYSQVDQILKEHSESLRYFYKEHKDEDL